MKNENMYYPRGVVCDCPERKKLAQHRKWVITQYHWNSGASSVLCLMCGGIMITKARYVDKLDMIPPLIAIPIERGIRQNREKYESWSIPALIKEFTTL
jgi:hypothetical protein